MVWPIINAVSPADMLGGQLGQVKRGGIRSGGLPNKSPCDVSKKGNDFESLPLKEPLSGGRLRCWSTAWQQIAGRQRRKCSLVGEAVCTQVRGRRRFKREPGEQGFVLRVIGEPIHCN